MRKKTVFIAVSAVCGVAGLGSWALISHGGINATISATGNPNAVVTGQVGSQVSGRNGLVGDFNTKVTKGQLIAHLDPASLQSKVDEGQANLESARANATNAQAGIQKSQASTQAASASAATAQANVVKAGVATQDAKT
jgi:HlyD family secretion protein